ncbi:hypothetical protein J2T15_003496 [Paenibacillus harenae]|uniref:Uncharacterized protein n=1 Tax=Paenibacillus harenae TaxID=306543 RepID=A0ABT9U4X8_PAEHA|nr:hypothetical protein [Paenibacillus harenae]MDQ0114053.1 hypothetical protein [Paenibacillus harenae]
MIDIGIILRPFYIPEKHRAPSEFLTGLDKGMKSSVWLRPVPQRKKQSAAALCFFQF